MINAIYAAIILLLPILLMGLLKHDLALTALLTLGWTLVAVVATQPPRNIADAILPGLRTGLEIVLLVFAAKIFYEVYEEGGYKTQLEKTIKREKGSAITLALAVYFSAFLETVSGFGVPVAVVAPMLVGLEVDPLIAVTVTMMGHSWGVPFASMGVPTLVLVELTEQPAKPIFAYTAWLMTPSLMIIAAIAAKKLEAPRKPLITALALAPALSITALAGPVAGTIAALIGFTGLLLQENVSVKEVFKNLAPYVLLSILLLTVSLLGLSGLIVSSICMLSLGVLYGAKSGLTNIVAKSLASLPRTTITIVSFTVVASLAGSSGLMTSLAKILAEIAGPFYALAVPIIGVIGTYITGSNTASNIIFSVLQASYAQLAGLDPAIILALQNVGGGLGSMISPAKIAVGTSTTHAKSIEPNVFRETFKIIWITILPLILVSAYIAIL
ncbi:MAG TPA: L-lactate permease [Thermofilum sp.]|nr:L-lactate permease [Thermofilum sp.]